MSLSIMALRDYGSRQMRNSSKHRSLGTDCGGGNL